MNLTYFQSRKRRNVENNNSPLNIRFVAKTSDIRNFSQNIRSDVEISEVATLQVRLNLKRLFKIEHASVKLIEIISGFSGRNFKLDCLNTVCTDIYI